MYLVFPRLRFRVYLMAIPTAAMLFLLEGAIPASLLLFAAVLHECGHLSALRLLAIPIRRIDILPMGALIAYDDTLCSHRQTAWIAFAGAGANLLAVILCLPFADSLYLLYFITANAALAVMNLIPIETLDGGTLLRSVLLSRVSADRTESFCRIVSRMSLFALALLFFGVGICSSFPLWYLLLSAVMLAQIFR